jgi:TolB protein
MRVALRTEYLQLMRTLPFLAIAIFLFSCRSEHGHDGYSGATQTSMLHFPQELHFDTIIQLTNGGDNAEAYWSFDNSKIVFQATNAAWGDSCDQIYFTTLADAERMMTERPQLISTGQGRTTCSYFMPGDTTIIYASTHLADPNCPPKPAKREDGKYVWPIYAGFDIFVADLEGNIIAQLTDTAGYDAEPTVSPKGDKIVFTSLRSGDLELYTMNIDGSEVTQITSELGYDGGAFFSPDGKKLIFRSSRPTTEEEIADYKALLEQGLVTPTEMELYICNVDGSVFPSKRGEGDLLIQPCIRERLSVQLVHDKP